MVSPRTSTGFVLADESPRWHRSALMRSGLLIVIAICIVGDTLGAPRAPWLPALALAVAGVGTNLALVVSTTRVNNDQPREHDSLRPRAITSWAGNPLTRRFAQLDRASTDRLSFNVSGVLEGIGAGGLGFLAYWFVDPRWALLALSATVAYFASVNLNIYLTPANYYPRGHDSAAFTRLRSLGGLVAAVVIAAITVPAFTGQYALAALALCSTLLAVQSRIRDTDAMFRTATRLVERARCEGRADINSAIHGHLMRPVGLLYRRLEQNPAIDRSIFDDVRNINGAIREILSLDRYADKDLGWAGLLVGRAEELLTATGMRTELTVGEDTISSTDGRTARIVFDELLTNAVKAGASETRVNLTLDSNCWTMVATDNGEPIADHAWLRPHGGLRRIETLLQEHSGRLEKTDSKTVTVTWRASAQAAAP